MVRHRTGVAGLALAAVTACGGSDSTTDSSPSNPGGSSNGRPATITLHADNPSTRLFIPVVWDMPHMLMVFRPLFRWTREGEIVGDLVRNWEVSDDTRTWTYHLRPDVRWHDGTPFTARDVAFTIELYQHREILAYPPGSALATVIDDSTVAVQYLMSSWDPLETYRVVLPAHLLGELDPADYVAWAFWNAPVGTGPFRFVRQTESSWSPDGQWIAFNRLPELGDFDGTEIYVVKVDGSGQRQLTDNDALDGHANWW